MRSVKDGQTLRFSAASAAPIQGRKDNRHLYFSEKNTHRTKSHGAINPLHDIPATPALIFSLRNQ
ncbi:hypothetical protein AV903_00170 [Erwinia tracheiphila]|uniref:Uncharacterized protein n=1 Tax=Erwinia tracheiphila TaxID=65700 RepID=A0A345CN68_9GAMM|nr:hypothetical protein AV903_00170 [Erwinia tracheiphila]